MADLGGEVSDLSNFLENHELQPKKWVPLFEKMNITKPSHIFAIKGSREHYHTLSYNASDEKEQQALRQLLNITDAIQDPDVEISGKLKEAGLDPIHWLPIFKNELGVTSLNALMNVGDESFGMLQQHAQKAWEKKGLRKLLGMKDEEISFQIQRQKQRVKFQMRQKESQEMLEQLKKLHKEGKHRHDDDVKQIESGIREALQISPNAWMPNDTTLETAIHRLESNIGQLDGILQTREEFSDVQVLQNASGGLALQGILLSRNLDDQLQNRDRLLKPTDGIQLMGPSLSKFEKMEEFSSQSREDQFRKSMDRLGYSASTSAKGGYGGISVEVGGGYSQASESERASEHHQKELYRSTVKYSFVPLASSYFSDSQLQLSDDALRKLKVIEMLILSKSSSSAVQNECHKFFEQFGSHARRGYFHFGGIYWLKSISRGFEQKAMDTIKKLQREVVDMKASISFGCFVGASAEASHSKVKASFSGKYSEELVSMTTFEVTATGGPPEVSNLAQWKSGMSASNSTWSLIDCGTNIVPVWDIIQMNHQKDFKNPGKLLQTLQRTWQQMTKIHTESSLTEQPIREVESAAEDIRFIKTWCVSKEATAQCVEHLAELLQTKQELVRRSMNLQAWPDLYLSQPPVQRYLRFVMKFMQESSSGDTEYIKLLMKQLIKPSDVCLVKELTDISEWLYHTDITEKIVALECTDLETLKTIIEANLQETVLAKAKSSSMYEDVSEQHVIMMQATTVVTKAVNHLRNSFTEAKLKYEDLFLVTLLLPCQYDVTDRMFLHLLSTNDLEYLRNELSNQSKAFSHDSPTKFQAYLFELTVKMYSREDVYVTDAQVKHHIEYLQREMKNDIDPQVRHALIQFGSVKQGWKSLQFQLASVVKGISLEHKEGNELLKILSEAEMIKPTSHSESASVSEAFLTDADLPHSDVHRLFKNLGLLKYYPQKLTLQDALLIRQETLGNQQCTSMEWLPYFILQKLMMHDYQCRGVLFQDRTTSRSLALTNPSQQHDDFDDFDDFDDSPTNGVLSSESALSIVNPMDGLLALLHSSNNFLRQELTTRLSSCQLAIPFLLPNPFNHTLSLSLWAMRRTVKEWKSIDPKTGKSKAGGSPIVVYPTPIVSFYRLTSNGSEHSKSRILNDVISDSPHNYFFHFHCDGGSTKSLLMDGLVELCWFLPGGKPNDPFAQVITFTNLRGDALSHPKQTKFLSQISFMNFVMLSEDDLNEKSIKILQDFANAPGGMVLLFLDREFTQKGRMTQLTNAIPNRSQLYRMKLSGKSAADIKTSIREQIKKKLTSSQQRFLSIEECADIARDSNIFIDEDDPECVQGRELASDIRKVLVKLQPRDKDEVLPLQSRKLWHEWAMHDKEQHRHRNVGAKGIEQYNAEMDHEKLMIRVQQLSIAEDPSPVMRTFLSHLLKHKGNIRNYFLQWLKFILDDHSRRKLPLVFSQYQEIRMQLLKLQREHKTGQEDAKQKLKERLDELNEKLVHGSFGIEHLLREIGQMYEATVQQTNMSPQLTADAQQTSASQMLTEQIHRLPQVAAELLACGYPIELMDGDASHVPVCWVTAVLDKLCELLQDARLFVLSVLGIQSTGKSTLLNTMFGLRFTVSAGRCTRGAFMQLLAFNESLKKVTDCDYLLIVDTEGLRAPELSSQETQRHDNELATFVIGLANVTLINIFGETPGDMDDILQSTVHAFIRLNHVGLKPSCQFVHQNVGALSGANRGMMGRVNFQEKLNKMTKAAAKEESLEGHYTMFSHVIEFSEEKDVWYFPGLWKGDPPLAPVNLGYSDRAQQLKLALIEKTRLDSKCLLSDFKVRTYNLWEAILHENFIFSFKNTLEITAYNHLDAKYADWSWEFQKKMLEWQNAANHRIQNAHIDSLDGLKGNLIGEISEQGKQIHAHLENEMKKFFESNEQQEILAQWQRRTELRLDELRKEHETDATEQCKVRINARKAHAEANTWKGRSRDDLLLLVKKLISNLEKGQLSEEQLDKVYEDHWIEWMTKLKASHQLDLSSPPIETSLENCLKELLASHHNLLIPKLSKEPLRTRRNTELKLEIAVKIHISANRIYKGLWTGKSNIRAVVQPEHIKRVKQETGNFLEEARKYLEEKSREEGNFNPAFCHELLKNLFQAISDVQGQCPEFNFTSEYKVDIALTVCRHARVVFEQMAENFRLMNDPAEYLQREMKTPYLRLFKTEYQQTAQEKTAAHNLYDRLLVPIKEKLVEKLAKTIAQEVKASSSSFATKRALKAKILHDLLDEDSFSAYINYLRNVKESVEAWIKKYVWMYCQQSTKRGKTEVTKLTLLAESELEHIVMLISSAAKKVTDNFSKNTGTCLPQIQSSDMWLLNFHGELEEELTLDLGEMQQVVGGLKDFKNFTAELCKKLGELHIRNFRSAVEDMDKWDKQKQPHLILFKSLIGCCEQCPFCKEQCELTDPNHSGKSHSVSLHRSQCLGGVGYYRSREMVLTTCNSFAASDTVFYYTDKDGTTKTFLFKKYRELYPSWSISPDSSLEAALYWKRFLAKYTTEVAQYFSLEKQDIPETWGKLTPERVKKDLNDRYLL